MKSGFPRWIMQPLAKTLIATLTIIVSLLAGCVPYNSRWSGYRSYHASRHSNVYFDDLLDFSANMAKISPSARAKVCRTLTQQGASPGTKRKLYRMSGRLFSGTCGDIASILADVAAIPSAKISDERLRKLIAIQSEALRSLQYETAVQDYMERNPKPAVPVPKRKQRVQKTPSNDEARLLREKLEAIRAMEKQLDGIDDLN